MLKHVVETTHTGGRRSYCLVSGVILLVFIIPAVTAGSGCMSKAIDGGFPHSTIAACRGKWHGHIKYAGELCAPGWEVCDWDKDGHVLSRISWRKAISMDGCFAYNAAQDGGRCRACKTHLNQDDLAGMGRSCPHQNKGQTSCISGGRIDASCCVDSHISLNTACRQQPWIDGVMCCQRSIQKPVIIAPPPERMDVNVGRIFMLSCHATGSPPPRVEWYKDGAKIPSDNSRISTISGDLLVTLSRRSDSGLYSCEVINEEGIDIAHTQVLVKEHESGCADGKTEGLSMHKDIHACSGRWKGHIKEGSVLCNTGWRVCNSHDEERLKDLNWLDIFDIKGCHAYNAANNKAGKCRRCHNGRGKLAGVGRSCGRVRYSRDSCLSQGRIDVFKTRDMIPKQNSCWYKEGITTGVLCCRKYKKSRNEVSKPQQKPHCSLGCENGGQCVGYNVCMCPVGYKGAMCQNAVCPDGCGSRARCVSPGKCECIHPYTGSNCTEKKHRSRCKSRCLNGGRCRKGTCKCPPAYKGSACQHLSKHILLSHLNRTER